MRKKIGWGIVGSGGIADRRTIPGLLKCANAELVACMDRSEEIARGVAQKYGAKRWCADLSELLGADVDAVYIATPVFAHEEQARAALAAGKHVLIEKPLAMNAESAAALVRDFRAQGRLIMAGYMMRYHNLHREIRRILSEGGIGKPVGADLRFSCWYPPIAGSWRQDPEKGGGGALMDLGVHCADLLCWLTGAQVVSVKSYCTHAVHDYAVEDGADVLLKMSDGMIARIRVNFNLPDALPSRVEFVGSAGSVTATGTLGQTEAGALDWIYSPQAAYDAAQNRAEPVVRTFEGAGGDLYAKQVEDFSRRVLEGNLDCSFAESSVNVQKIIESVYRNAEEL